MKPSLASALLALAAITGASAPVYGQVFKCSNQQGKITFTDKPCSPSDKSSIAHEAMNPEQAWKQERQHRAAMANRAMQPATTHTTIVEYEVYETEQRTRHSGATRSNATGPGNRGTVSTLLPHGAGISQRSAARQQSHTQRIQHSPPPPPAPTVMTHCKGGFCHDNQGGVYSGIGRGQMISPAGKICRPVGAQIICN